MLYRGPSNFSPIRETAFGVITNSFLAVGTALTVPGVAVVFAHNTDAIIEFSDDGINPCVRLVPGERRAYDIRANRPVSEDYVLALGTQLYVRYLGAAPTEGSAWVEILQARGRA